MLNDEKLTIVLPNEVSDRPVRVPESRPPPEVKARLAPVKWKTLPPPTSTSKAELLRLLVPADRETLTSNCLVSTATIEAAVKVVTIHSRGDRSGCRVRKRGYVGRQAALPPHLHQPKETSTDRRRRWLRSALPTSPKPANISAQLPGSGTAP